MERFTTAEGGEWEAYVARNQYPLAMEHVDPRFRAMAHADVLPRGISITEMAHGLATLHRTQRLVHSDPSDDLLFLIQLSGSSRIEQGDARRELRAGEAAFFDPSAPYRIHTHPGQEIVIMVPRDAIPPARGAWDGSGLRPLSTSLAPLRMLRLLSEEVLSESSGATELERDGVASATLELLRTLARIASGADAPARTRPREALLARAKALMIERIADPTLTVDRVAAEVHVSTRHLTELFAPEDSPGAFLRRTRLRGAQQDLQDPRRVGETVADIARRWGYADASAFSRAYRLEHGRTPSRERRG
jgi:AraC family transcriptional activator of tynA and feaB